MNQFDSPVKGLTKHTVGSVRELWSLSYPLMLMAFSTYGMVFADRLIVSNYDVNAMNAVGMVIMVFEAFHYGVLMVALIAEVFVGQYNGSGQESKIGKPVWAMIWFSIMSAIIFWPCGLFLGEYFLQEPFWDYGLIYFKTLMLFGPLPPMIGALSAFFIGRGKTFIVTTVVIIGNIINLGLDILYVFGIDGWLEPMGTLGAALATGIGMTIQLCILAFIFLKEEYRNRFGTGQWRFDWSEFKKCLKVGWPNAISANVGILAWVVFFRWMADYGFVYLTTLIICQNYFYIFTIITEGMGKGLGVISANLIGAKQHDAIKSVMISGVKLLIIFGLILSIPLVFWQSPFITLFLGGDIDTPVLQQTLIICKDALIWMWLLFFCWGGYWLLSSQLMSAGDTQFLMYANMASAWCFLVLPAYLVLKIFNWDASISWKLMVFDIGMCMLLFLWRYRSNKWKEKSLF